MSRTERKLGNEQKKCNICGGDLRELSDKEKRMIKTSFGTGFDFPRGIYICDVCNQVATIGLTTTDMENEEWTEIVENLNKDDIYSEKEAIGKILETVSSLPEQHTVVISLGHLFKCEGKGVGCSLYKIASCGRGPKEFCPGRWCNYDPYPQEYKKLFWLRMESSWPKNRTDIVAYWFDLTKNKASNAETRVDAVNRVGTIATKSVSQQLCDLFSISDETGVKEAVLIALSKQKASPDIEQILYQGLGYDSPTSTQLLLLKQLRAKHCQYDIIELAKKVSYLTVSQNEEVKGWAKKTLQLLKKQASKEKPDLQREMSMSAKD